ncbi:MAG: hypothetical protein C0592_12750, partial [Marinilabiliales bacterium]
MGVIFYFSLGSDSAEITVNGRQVTDSSVRNTIRWSVSGGIAGLGGIFLISGIIGFFRHKQAYKERLYIMRTGVETEGTVTFVDKNYSFLVNNRPIFSIVEYIYEDKYGNSHSRRVNSISSDIVVRNQIQVGSIIAIKYAIEDPSKSIILLQEKAKKPSPIVKCNYCGTKFSI